MLDLRQVLQDRRCQEALEGGPLWQVTSDDAGPVPCLSAGLLGSVWYEEALQGCPRGHMMDHLLSGKFSVMNEDLLVKENMSSWLEIGKYGLRKFRIQSLQKQLKPLWCLLVYRPKTRDVVGFIGCRIFSHFCLFSQDLLNFMPNSSQRRKARNGQGCHPHVLLARRFFTKLPTCADTSRLATWRGFNDSCH